MTLASKLISIWYFFQKQGWTGYLQMRSIRCKILWVTYLNDTAKTSTSRVSFYIFWQMNRELFHFLCRRIEEIRVAVWSGTLISTPASCSYSNPTSNNFGFKCFVGRFCFVLLSVLLFSSAVCERPWHFAKVTVRKKSVSIFLPNDTSVGFSLEAYTTQFGSDLGHSLFSEIGKVLGMPDLKAKRMAVFVAIWRVFGPLWQSHIGKIVQRRDGSPPPSKINQDLHYFS